MAKTHGPQHFDSVREKLRPRHQVLILKCYPRLPKNSSADVKPNSSELAYLTYYVSHKEVKLQKVGAFIHKRTAKEVSNSYSARVLVTLQILTALLHTPKVGSGSALALFAPYVLGTITEVLKSSTDIGLIEGTLPTWDALCRNQDQTLLAADHEYREVFEQTVSLYTDFAQKTGAKKLGRATASVAVHDAIRLRKAGLGAIQSLLLSDVVAFQSGRQMLNISVTAILGNLQADDASYLTHLISLSKSEEEKDKAVNRRQSMATVHTSTRGTEGSVDIDPRQAEGTVQDADQLAEEEVALLALDCLKTVFATDQRAQVRSATTAILSYAGSLRIRQRPQTAAQRPVSSSTNSWAVKIFEICTTWTPVQDRFVLLVTAVETMVSLPVKESDLRQHLLFTDLIDDILRSDLNLIGLSVMDVLLGLVQQTLRVLQLSSAPGTATASNSAASSVQEFRPATSASLPPSGDRLQVISGLKSCIADLGTHVYYTDQISDMISAILLRLKPSPAPTGGQDPLVTAAAIEEPKVAVDVVASNVSPPTRGRSNSTSGFFSFDVARRIALEAVRDILRAANPMRLNASGSVADNRSPVPISIWEGTQWLLRDPSIDVRRAYVDALTTWLQLETKKIDARLHEPKTSRKRNVNVSGGAGVGANGTLARRAVSNASTKDRQVGVTNNKKQTSKFLQLLHLANYENALQFATSSSEDIVLLHRLMATLVQRLGMNAVQSGLPMILTLQEHIAKVESPVAKVRIGSLVHGYLWTLVEVFDCSLGNRVKRTVLDEISRRKDLRLWVQTIQYPLLEASTPRDASNISMDPIQELKAFDDRQELIDIICDSYSSAVTSPPPSSPGSPGRTFSIHAMDRQASQSSYLTAKKLNDDPELLSRARQAMATNWSKDECLAHIAAMAPKSVSLSGSRSSPRLALTPNSTAGGGMGNYRSLLAAANTGIPTSRNGTSPARARQNSGQLAPRAQIAVNPDNHSPDRQPSHSSIGGYARGGSSLGATGPLRIADLKRVLAGGVPHKRGHEMLVDETGSDSMMEAGDVNSVEGYATPPTRQPATRSTKDVNTLLASVRIDSDADRRKVVMSRPPY